MTKPYTRRPGRGLAASQRALIAVAAVLTLLALLALPARADDNQPDKIDHYLKSHQVGLRLGGWANQGDTPADSVGTTSDFLYYLTDFTEGNAYLEGFFTYRINPYLASEFSVGIVSRGDVTLRDDILQSTSFGSMVIYPILLKARLYPLGPAHTRFHPYVMAGGGVYYGKHDIQITDNYTGLTPDLDQSSETVFSYVLGAGVDWPLAEVLGLGLQAQYMPIDFTKNLVGVQDYSSVTFTIGVQYLFHSKGNRK